MTAKVHHSHYSVRKLLGGLDNAAVVACELTVNNANNKEMIAAAKKFRHVISVL